LPAQRAVSKHHKDKDSKKEDAAKRDDFDLANTASPSNQEEKQAKSATQAGPLLLPPRS